MTRFFFLAAALAAAPVTSAWGQNGASAKPTVIANSGNGVGNTTIVDGTGKGGVRVVNSRNGIGNQILVRDGKVIDLNELRYKGKDYRFWTKKTWDRELATTLYWCPKTDLWFRYDAMADAYRPAVEVLTRDLDRTLREVDRMLEDLDRQLAAPPRR